MTNCERCGEKIGLVPQICWKCFYEFWNVRTPEQKGIILEIQRTAITQFGETLIKEIKEHYLYRHLDERMEDMLFELIRAHAKELYR